MTRASQGAPRGRGGSGEMFDAIAGRYDLLNRVLSLGLDQSWRRRAVRALALDDRALRPAASPVVADLATGTADLAIAIAAAHPRARVFGIDPSEGMRAIAARKIAAAGLTDRIELRDGDAERLDLPDAGVDAISMAFGIRNVPDRPRALREMARVTRPGGRIVLLELSEPQGRVLGRLARLHVHTLVPLVGAALSGATEYSYLQDSIARFPPPDEFAAQMTAAGLRVLEVHPLTFGAACLFVATPAAAPA